jgi:hypothetical protein
VAFRYPLASLFGLTAALYGAITLKDGRVEQSNFHHYRPMRIDEIPVVETHVVKSSEAPGHRRGGDRDRRAKCSLPRASASVRCRSIRARC